MLNQIFLNANVIITFLDNLENAVTFAKMHVPHSDILTKHLKEMLSELQVHYDKKEILALDLDSWYLVIKINCHFSGNKIILAMECPIIYPRSFQYFHLFPIPTISNSLIIPKKTYLALEDESYQYMEHPWIQLQNLYICEQAELKFNLEEDCISSLIQDKKVHCQQTPIQQPSKIFNKINEEYLIIMISRRNQIKVKMLRRTILLYSRTSTFTNSQELYH